MKCFHYVLTDELTRSSRKMTSLMKEASRFSSRVSLLSEANGQLREEKSMRRGSSITVTVEGRDEEAAIAAIANYVVANM